MSAAEKLIFSTSVQAMLDVAVGRIKPDTEKALAALGLHTRKKVDPAYPADTWAEAVRLISADLFPGLDAEAQHRKLGRAVVERFSAGFLGAAMYAAAKVFGARRSLERMTHNFRTGANFIETRFTVVDPKHFELWMNDVSGVPGFYAGLLEAGADQMPGWPDVIRVKQRDGAACLFSLESTR